MGNKLKELIKLPIVRVFIIITILTIVGGTGWAIAQTQQPPDQPIEFPHNKHVGLGIQCLYCHPGAWKGASSGLPTQSKCWGCHQQIEKQHHSNHPSRQMIDSHSQGDMLAMLKGDRNTEHRHPREKQACQRG